MDSQFRKFSKIEIYCLSECLKNSKGYQNLLGRMGTSTDSNSYSEIWKELNYSDPPNE